VTTWDHEAMTEIRMKYKTVQNKATSVYGVSAGQLPNHVSKRKLEMNLQKTKRAIGEKCMPLKTKLVEEIENTKRNMTDSTNPATPPSLLGIERKIA